MLSYTLVVFGIILMICAAVYSTKIAPIISSPKLKKTWRFLYVLIWGFLIGYLIYLLVSLLFREPSTPTALLVSSILFFGAIFVVVVVSVIYQLIRGLNDSLNKIQSTLDDLQQKTTELEKVNVNLQNTQKTLQDKNHELEQTLDAFYTYRLSLQKNLNVENFEEENRKIKAKLDELKR